MTTKKQVQAARQNVKKAQQGAAKKHSLANLPSATKTALGKQGAAVAARNRRHGSTPHTKAELYAEARRRDIQGRSKMGRAELAKALGHE